jgi:hypothetical protein
VSFASRLIQEKLMRKLILVAVAGYLWKKFMQNRVAGPAVQSAGRPIGAAQEPLNRPRAANHS